MISGLIILAFFAILCFAPYKVSKMEDKEQRNKYMKIYVIFFISAFIWLPLVGQLGGLLDKKLSIGVNDSNTSSVADGFTIEGYEVILDVGLDNKIDVTENIDVNFYESGHHGIYKFTPTWLEYTGNDNKTIKRKSNVINYRAIGNQYTVDVVNKNKQRIKIGSPYITIDGNQKYVIKYKPPFI